MFPYSFPYNTPSYSSTSQPYADSQYLRAVSEEQAARQAYADALRAQEEARSRAARARRAREAYERAHNSYLSDDDDDMMSGYAYSPRVRPGYGFFPERAMLDEQRRRELEQQRRKEALELERARERERIRQLEEEQKRRLLEEERRRRILLEEELRRQQEKEEREQEDMRRRLQDEYLRRQSLSPLEELFGLRPSRSMQSDPQSHTHRARTMSPPTRSMHREPSERPAQRISPTAAPAHATRTQSRSPVERIPIYTPPPRAPSSPKQAHSPSPARKSPTPPQPQAPPVPKPTPEQIAAAAKIQEQWRTHAQRRKALQAISRIAASFESCKAAFTLPAHLDYQLGDVSHHVTVPVDLAGADADDIMRMDMEALPHVPKLAYTPTNAPVHVYEEELNRMLTQLDEVQSGGDGEVRSRRRELARKVEREAERIERVKVTVWKAWEARQEEAKREEAKPMAVDEPKEAESAAAMETEPVSSVAEPEAESSQPPIPEVVVTPAESAMDVDASQETLSVDVEVAAEPPAPIVEEPMEEEQEETKEERETESILAVETAEKVTVTSDAPSVEEPAEPSSTIAPDSTSAPPPLVDSQSESGASEPQTPVHEEPEDVPMRDSEAKSNAISEEKLASLRPLINQEWDETDDLF